MKINLPGTALRDDLIALACQTTMCGNYADAWTFLPCAAIDCCDEPALAGKTSEEAWANLAAGPLATLTATLSRADAITLARGILFQAGSENPLMTRDVLDAMRGLVEDLQELHDACDVDTAIRIYDTDRGDRTAV